MSMTSISFGQLSIPTGYLRTSSVSLSWMGLIPSGEPLRSGLSGWGFLIHQHPFHLCCQAHMDCSQLLQPAGVNQVRACSVQLLITVDQLCLTVSKASKLQTVYCTSQQPLSSFWALVFFSMEGTDPCGSSSQGSLVLWYRSAGWLQ